MHRLRTLGILALLAGCGTAISKGGFEEEEARRKAAAEAEAGAGGGGQLGGEFGDGGGGTGGSTCAAATASAQKAEVDIIFIVDVSGSMGEEIAQVKANINKFSGSVGQSGLDYQVVMIAPRGTGKFEVCVDAPLGGPACADNAPKFRQLNQKVGSTDTLSLLVSTYDLGYKQFLRQSATKVFIVITDDNSKLSSAQFDSQILAKDPAMFGDTTKRRYILDAICGWTEGTPLLSATKCPTSENTGDQHQQLAQLTGGIVDSVCKTDYSGVFNNIAKGIATKLGCELKIPQGDAGAIDPNKVVVQYTPAGMPAKPLTQVTDESKCATVTDGWFYDNAAAPTKILLCPTECTAIGNDTSGQLDLLIGCQAPQAK